MITDRAGGIAHQHLRASEEPTLPLEDRQNGPATRPSHHAPTAAAHSPVPPSPARPHQGETAAPPHLPAAGLSRPSGGHSRLVAARHHPGGTRPPHADAPLPLLNGNRLRTGNAQCRPASGVPPRESGPTSGTSSDGSPRLGHGSSASGARRSNRLRKSRMGLLRCASGASLLVTVALPRDHLRRRAAAVENHRLHHDDGAANHLCSVVSRHPARGCTSTRHPVSPTLRRLDLEGSGALRRESPVHYVYRRRGRVVSVPRTQRSTVDLHAAHGPGGDRSRLRAQVKRHPRSRWTSTTNPLETDRAAPTSGARPSGRRLRTRAPACSAPRRTWTAWRRRSSSTTSTCGRFRRTSSRRSRSGTRRTRRRRCPSSSTTTLVGRRIRSSWTRFSSFSASGTSTTRTRGISATSTHRRFLGRRTVLGRLRPRGREARGYRPEALDPHLVLAIARCRLDRPDEVSPPPPAVVDRRLVLLAYPAWLLRAAAAASLPAKLMKGSPRSVRARTARSTRPGESRTAPWLPSSASAWSRRRMASPSHRCVRSSFSRRCATRMSCACPR